MNPAIVNNDLSKRLMWSGLLAGLGALVSIITHRLATEIWMRVFKEDPPHRLMATEPNHQDTGAATAAGPAPEVNEGATGNRPMGESPLSVESEDDPFAKRPEAFVGGAFAGGFVLALILRRFAP